jgi:hypothetical protein
MPYTTYRHSNEMLSSEIPEIGAQHAKTSTHLQQTNTRPVSPTDSSTPPLSDTESIVSSDSTSDGDSDVGFSLGERRDWSEETRMLLLRGPRHERRRALGYLLNEDKLVDMAKERGVIDSIELDAEDRDIAVYNEAIYSFVEPATKYVNATLKRIRLSHGKIGLIVAYAVEAEIGQPRENIAMPPEVNLRKVMKLYEQTQNPSWYALL